MGYAGPQFIGGGASSGFAGFAAIALSADTALDAPTHNNKSLEMTTGATDRTLTLPTSGNADGDEIIITKVDQSVGRVKIASLIGATNRIWLRDRYSWVRVHYSANLGWIPIAASDETASYRSGNYICVEAGGFTGISWPAGNRIYCTPIRIHKPITLSAMAALVTTAGDASSYLVLGIYSNKSAAPDALIAQTAFASGQLAASATGIVEGAFVGGNITLPPGIYWIACAASYTSTPSISGGSSFRPILGLIGSSDPNQLLQATSFSGGFFTSFVAGSSLPATAGTFTPQATTTQTAALKVA